jgi:hypothetical protein
LHERTGVAKVNASPFLIFFFFFHTIAPSYAFVFGIATEAEVFHILSMPMFSSLFQAIGVKARSGMAFVMA